MESEKLKRKKRESESSEVRHRGGAVRWSDEVSVMGMEQRDCLMWLEMGRQPEAE